MRFIQIKEFLFNFRVANKKSGLQIITKPEAFFRGCSESRNIHLLIMNQRIKD